MSSAQLNNLNLVSGGREGDEGDWYDGVYTGWKLP